METSIIMPSLNEEKGLKKILGDFPFEEFKKRNLKCNLVLVDGGSTDNTLKIAKKNRLTIINSKRGYGLQYQSAFKKVGSDYILTMDSDASYDSHDLIKLYDYLIEKDLDFVSGDRISNLKKKVMKKHHYIANKYLNFWIKILFGIRLKDSQSGMWVFKKGILTRLKLRSKGMPFSEEIKIEAFKKLKSAEIPIDYKERLGNPKIRTVIDGHLNFFYLFAKRFFDFFE